MAASLTILIPTHDRPEVLAKVWQSWIKQEGVKEIVIVNDGGSPGYGQVFSDISAACDAQNVRLKIIETTSRMGAPAAKNVGLAECSSDEVLTTDDDILLPNDMVARCRAQRPTCDSPVLVGPRVIYLKDDESIPDAVARSAQENKPFFDMKNLTLCPWAHPGKVTEYPFVTAVVLWPAEVFRKGLRFFEGYGGNGYREETDPQLKAAMDFGARVYLTPEAHCFHLPPGIAYARNGGQRRGGRLWFEYWVLRNNALFLKRFSEYLCSQYKLSPFSLWLRLAMSRISRHRLRKFFTKDRCV